MQILTEKEAAPLVGLAVKTLQTLRCRGGGPPFVKLGRSVRYRSTDLEEWLEERVVHSTSEKVAA